METNRLAGPIANQANHGRKASPLIPVGQIWMKTEVRILRNRQPATGKVTFGRRARDGQRSLLHYVRSPARPSRFSAEALSGRRRSGAPGVTPAISGRLGDEGRAIEARGPGDRVDGTAALVAVEVMPVACMRSLEADDAGSGAPRFGTPDVGKPPLIADAPAIGKQPRHPFLCSLPQPAHNQIKVVLRSTATPRRLDIVEIDDGGAHPASFQQRVEKAQKRQTWKSGLAAILGGRSLASAARMMSAALSESACATWGTKRDLLVMEFLRILVEAGEQRDLQLHVGHVELQLSVVDRLGQLDAALDDVGPGFMPSAPCARRVLATAMPTSGPATITPSIWPLMRPPAVSKPN